ncbi:nucleotidyltransferase domain-containing protein [Spirosoma radiotolerans]|uniref:DNA polymerase subunit beta n=1 Tax=Spirosoma radiotolerans TaxID=1379870 RepID=A0A0E3ZTU8_9BACT|nr:nucleotidyltransferase domain-containing protein [Spirosoma radiotolerans]AKD54138.1 DNA polymerase subunit beta [Spirosoma radiotolerans]
MQTTYQPKALSGDQLQALSQEVKQALTELYGERLDRVILYGSYARGDFHAESDVDYLVLLRDEQVKAGKEVRMMAPSIGALALQYDVEVSVFPTSLSNYLSGHIPLYESIQQEGICA